LWKKQAKDEQITKMIEKAQNRAGQYSQSGMDNALRTEFRKLAQNDRAMRRFSPQERAAIQEVARGGGAIEKVSRWVGKLSPRGVVSAAGGAVLGGGAGSALAGDPYVGAGGAFALGGLGQAIATALTKRNVRNASEVMRGGRLPPSSDQDALLAALKALYLQQQPQFSQ
jgi:hypothetical protein